MRSSSQQLGDLQRGLDGQTILIIDEVSLVPMSATRAIAEIHNRSVRHVHHMLSVPLRLSTVRRSTNEEGKETKTKTSV